MPVHLYRSTRRYNPEDRHFKFVHLLIYFVFNNKHTLPWALLRRLPGTSCCMCRLLQQWLLRQTSHYTKLRPKHVRAVECLPQRSCETPFKKTSCSACNLRHRRSYLCGEVRKSKLRNYFGRGQELTVSGRSNNGIAAMYPCRGMGFWQLSFAMCSDEQSLRSTSPDHSLAVPPHN
jgi:hypothetical protein